MRNRSIKLIKLDEIPSESSPSLNNHIKTISLGCVLPLDYFQNHHPHQLITVALSCHGHVVVAKGSPTCTKKYTTLNKIAETFQIVIFTEGRNGNFLISVDKGACNE